MSLSSAPPTLAPRASRAGRGLERGPAVGAPDEAGLVAALRSGDEAAFNEFLTRHHASMVRLAQSYVSSHAVAEEVVQETLEVVLTRLERFERRSTLKTWMFRILVNRAKT